MKQDKLLTIIAHIILIIILIFSIVWLVKVTIPYYKLEIQSRQAIVEMSKNYTTR